MIVTQYKMLVNSCYTSLGDEMTVTAIICEYNPFHFGHAYQIKMAREITQADFIVVVMSGNFVQRGEPAIVNKWTRAEMALLGGVDLVLELPVPFATSSAAYFAHGAAQLLDATGVVDYLCFGSELGSIEPLQEIAKILLEETPSYKSSLKENLAVGLSYPAARANALPAAYREIVNAPNNILGIEYIKALTALNSKIKPVTVKRIGAGYNETTLSTAFASATSIRNSILETKGFQSISSHVSEATYALLMREISEGRGPVSQRAMFESLRYKIRSTENALLANYPGITEGLEARMRKAFAQATTFEEAVAAIATKRYPRTRIARSLLAIYLGIDCNMLDCFIDSGPTYVRVLGMKESASTLLKAMNNSTTLEISMKLKPLVSHKQESISALARTEMLSTDLYVLLYPAQSSFKHAGQEFLNNPIIVSKS
ncbi:MAG: nucleotidyltransferase [Clostridia bacterium]